MNRREFTKALGLAPVALMTAKAKVFQGKVEDVKINGEPVPVEDRVYGLTMPPGTPMIHYANGFQFISVNPRSHFKLEMKNHA